MSTTGQAAAEQQRRQAEAEQAQAGQVPGPGADHGLAVALPALRGQGLALQDGADLAPATQRPGGGWCTRSRVTAIILISQHLITLIIQPDMEPRQVRTIHPPCRSRG